MAKKKVSKSRKKAQKVKAPKEEEVSDSLLNLNLGPKGYIKPKGNPSKDVNIDNVTMSIPGGGRFLLEKAQVKFTEGHRYGLVGKNGSGKTTLLNLISTYSLEEMPRYIRFLLVAQESSPTEHTVLDTVLKNDERKQQIEEEEERLVCLQAETEDPEENAMIGEQLNELYELQETLDLDTQEQRASRILNGLGLDSKMQKMKTKELSGGFRVRVALAAALFIEPDVLLLDEPTNHLDFPSVLWLQDYLLNYKKTLIVVSHDRSFLNDVITDVIHLEHKKLNYYKGNYEGFIHIRDQKRRELQNAYDAQLLQITQIKEYVEKFRDKGEKRQAQVQSKLKVLDKLEREGLLEPPKDDKEFHFRFPDVEKVEMPVVVLEDVVFGYTPERVILQNINLAVDMESRVGVIGANGVGKSTLIKIMLQKLEPTSGEVHRNQQTRIAVFTQHHMDQLDLSVSAVEFLLTKFAADLEGRPDVVQFVRRNLGRYGISGDRQVQKMKFLSGGEKSRVAFCVLTWHSPSFLIMDEPTNHLDMETIESLVEAIQEFEGGVLAISHDQYFLQAVADQFWSVTPDKIMRFRKFGNAKKFSLQHRLGED